MCFLTPSPNSVQSFSFICFFSGLGDFLGNCPILIGTVLRKPVCWRINSAILYTSMSTKNLSISCLLGNIFYQNMYNARIQNSSASQYAVSLNCTGTNNQLMSKHCNKNDKITTINYQQPHYLLITVIYLKIMKRNRYFRNETGSPVMRITLHQKFCYQSYQNSIDKHIAPSCLTKKRVLQLLQKRHIDNYPKE